MLFVTALVACVAAGLEPWEKCQFYCTQCGDRGKGLKKQYDRLRSCGSYLYKHRFLGRGPWKCRKPHFKFTREQAEKFYPLRVCTQESDCIKAALALKHNNKLQGAMKKVLAKRTINSDLKNEIRFSRDKDYVRSVNRLTDATYLRELKAYIKARGFDTKTRFKNPVFLKNLAVLKENMLLEKKLKSTYTDGTLKERNKYRARFNNRVPRRLAAVERAKSLLKSKATAKKVAADLREIKKQARYVRQLQAEAHRLLFIEREFVQVRDEVKEKQREIEKWRLGVSTLAKKRSRKRELLSSSKRSLVNEMRMATIEVTKVQKNICDK